MVSTDSKGLGVMVKGIDPARSGKVTEIETNLCCAITVDADHQCIRCPKGGFPMVHWSSY